MSLSPGVRKSNEENWLARVAARLTRQPVALISFTRGLPATTCHPERPIDWQIEVTRQVLGALNRTGTGKLEGRTRGEAEPVRRDRGSETAFREGPGRINQRDRWGGASWCKGVKLSEKLPSILPRHSLTRTIPGGKLAGKANPETRFGSKGLDGGTCPGLLHRTAHRLQCS